MTDVSLLPTVGYAHGGGWGNAGAAALGAFVGSWFGNGWGGNGFNRGGFIGDGGAVVAGASAFGTNLVMDNLNQVQNSINGLGLNVVQGQCSLGREVAGVGADIQSSLCQGFSQSMANANQNTNMLNNTSVQGFAGVNATINSTNAMTNNYLAQGFAGLNTAIQTNGYESRLAVKDLAAQQADCCCEIKNAIAAEGSATRQLIQNNLITELQTRLCDAKNKISTLESNMFTAKSNAEQTDRIVGSMLLNLRATVPATTTPATTA